MSFLDTTGPVAKDQWIYRQRSDDPDVLHYVTAKGIEGTGLFKDDTDRHSFLERFACILDETQTQCYSWALIPDQFHLLLQTDPIPLSKVMHRLMTGYAVTFNKRHRRSGYLFESRGAFAFSDNKLKNEKNVVFNLELLAFYYRPALILLNNGACSP
jgi:hypothetical protein